MIHFRNGRIATPTALTATRGMAALIALGACALIAAPGVASPGSGITSTVLGTGDLTSVVNYNHDRLKFQTKGSADVRVQQLDFAVGAVTGWHHHPGVVIVTVAAGLITTVDQDCKMTTYGPGSPNGSVFVEGHETPMEARNAATTVSTVYATYVSPDATPRVFRIEDTAQNCGAMPTFRNAPGN